MTVFSVEWEMSFGWGISFASGFAGDAILGSGAAGTGPGEAGNGSGGFAVLTGTA